MWDIAQSKHAETFTAHLLAPREPSGSWAIGILRPNSTYEWEGFAVLPNGPEAARRFYALEDDVDIEDLLREWGDPEGNEVVDFITFMAETSNHEGLGREDAPEIVVPKRLVRPPRKKKKPHKAKPEPEPPPYAPRAYPRPADAKADEVTLLPLSAYDHIIVSFSGGKDSVACALYLLELGIPPERIELWHQCVDGRPHHDTRMWDWPCTESYCEAFARTFGFPLLYQWKEGGFIGELLKRDQLTAPATFQLPDGREVTTEPGARAEIGTRLAFPAMAADLLTRWCSGYLKIDVAKKVFTNDPRFQGRRTVILTGERRQESGHRAKYADVTDYESTKTRTVHQWRAVLSWFEQDIWEIMQRYRVRPHPAYYLGWSRVSCLPCIFGNPDQWAAVKQIAPKVFKRLATLEDKFYIASQTIPSHPWSAQTQRRRWEDAQSPEGQMKKHQRAEAARKKKEGAAFRPKPFVLRPSEPFKLKAFDGYLRQGESLPEAAERGTSFIRPSAETGEWLDLAMDEHYPDDLIIVPPDEEWELPHGAFGHSGGPT